MTRRMMTDTYFDNRSTRTAFSSDHFVASVSETELAMCHFWGLIPLGIVSPRPPVVSFYQGDLSSGTPDKEEEFY
jgi:hypothetical protein